MIRSTTDLTTVVVVDPSPDDYRPLVDEGPPTIDFRFCGSGEEALRVGEPAEVGLWMINSRLPDMTGVELHKLLRPHLAKTPVFLVANAYDAAAEIAALSSGSMHFICKPLREKWFADVCRSLAARAPRPWPLPAASPAQAAFDVVVSKPTR